VKSGVVSLVILSVLLDPRSVSAVISGVPVAESATLSTVTVFVVAVLVFPAVSVCVIDIPVFVPSEPNGTDTEYADPAQVVVIGDPVIPACAIDTVAPVSQAPVKVYGD
jgi:hypothetical protein